MTMLCSWLWARVLTLRGLLPGPGHTGRAGHQIQRAGEAQQDQAEAKDSSMDQASWRVRCQHPTHRPLGCDSLAVLTK